MATIVTDIDKEAPGEELLKWYDYTIEASEFNLPVPDFDHWLIGCPRTPGKWFEDMRAKRKEITFFAKGKEDAKQKAAEWQAGQILLNCEDFEEIVMFLAQRKKLKKEKSNLFNYLQRLFDDGLFINTTELEFRTLEVTAEDRSQGKQITFFAKREAHVKEYSKLKLKLKVIDNRGI